MNEVETGSRVIWEDYGSFWSRFVAYILDYFIGGLLALVPALVGAGLAFAIADAAGPFSDDGDDQVSAVVQITVGGLSALGTLTYFWLGFSWKGTIGQRMMSLRVVDGENDGELGLRRGALRVLVWVLGAIPLYLGWLWCAWDDKKQTWHDKAVNSFVYKRPATAPEDDSHLRGWLVAAVVVAVAGIGLSALLGWATGEAAQKADEADVVSARFFVGDCLAMEGAAPQVVDCSGDSDGEVVGVFDATGAEFPGEDALAAMAEEQCPIETALYLYPLDLGWAAGDRQVVCVAE